MSDIQGDSNTFFFVGAVSHQFIIYYILFLSFWFACVFWPLSLPSQIVSIYFAVCCWSQTLAMSFGLNSNQKNQTKTPKRRNGDNSFLRFIRVSTCAIRNELNTCAPIACAFPWHSKCNVADGFFFRPLFFSWFVAFSMHLTRNSTYYFILVALIAFLFAFWLLKNVLFEEEKKQKIFFRKKLASQHQFLAGIIHFLADIFRCTISIWQFETF